MPWILAEFLVDEPDVRADETDGFSAHAAQLGMLLQEHEHLEQGRWVAREDFLMRHFQVIVAGLEARVDRQRRAALRQDGLAKQLQQHFVHQADVHDGAIVFLHQLFDGQREAGVLVAEHFRQLDLIVEEQPVLAPPGQRVQPEAHLPEKGLARLELAQFIAGEEAVGDQLVESVGAEVALRHPADGLNVAQAPGARFDVGLEVVRGVEVAVMALGLFLDLGFEEVLRGPEAVGRQRAAHAGEQRFRARQQARLEQGGRDADIGHALALAVVDGAHAVANLETDIPEKRQKFFDVRLPIGGVALRQQHHDVDIRTGV